MKTVSQILSVITVFSLSACATVVRGTTEEVVINYQPSDAKVVTDLGHTCQTSPCILSIERKKAFTVTASKSGFESKSVRVGTEVSKNGAAGLAGNVIVGGVIGAGVDVATGAARDHTPNPVNIELLPRGAAKRAPKTKPSAPSASGVPSS